MILSEVFNILPYPPSKKKMFHRYATPLTRRWSELLSPVVGVAGTLSSAVVIIVCVSSTFVWYQKGGKNRHYHHKRNIYTCQLNTSGDNDKHNRAASLKIRAPGGVPFVLSRGLAVCPESPSPGRHHYIIDRSVRVVQDNTDCLIIPNR